MNKATRCRGGQRRPRILVLGHAFGELEWCLVDRKLHEEWPVQAEAEEWQKPEELRVRSPASPGQCSFPTASTPIPRVRIRLLAATPSRSSRTRQSHGIHAAERLGAVGLESYTGSSLSRSRPHRTHHVFSCPYLIAPNLGPHVPTRYCCFCAFHKLRRSFSYLFRS